MEAICKRLFSRLFLVVIFVSTAFAFDLVANVQAQDEDASEEINLIEGMFDIGELELYMRCDGNHSPTIIYLHGSVAEGESGASNAFFVQTRMREHYRFCIYDRRNVGQSEEVSGYWTGVTAVEDLHALLGAADVEPPYVLVGAGIGGVIAHHFAAIYPEEVIGILLLDSNVPDEMAIEELLPEDMRYAYGGDIGSNEELDHFSAFQEAFALEAPAIPLTYMLATPSTWPTTGVPEWDAAILDTLQAYVDGFSPGTWVEVESPMCIECFYPQLVVEELFTLMEIIEQAEDAAS